MLIIRPTADSFTTASLIPLVTATLFSVYLALTRPWSNIDSPKWMWLAAIGAISACGHLLIVMAMSRAPASVLAPFGYVEIIAASTLGWLIFDDWPEPLTWTGIAVIVASGICVYYRERRQGRVTTAHVE